MSPYQEKVKVIKKEELGPQIFRLTFAAYDIAKGAKPGQFVMVKTSEDTDPLLRRPFSIHQVTDKGTLQVLLKVLGKGTKKLSMLLEQEEVSIVGPLGEGFSLPKQGGICLVGGGMGIAPLLFLAKSLLRSNNPLNIKILLGAQKQAEIKNLLMNFEDLGVDIHHATDDGSSGHHGFVTDLMEPILLGSQEESWNILCCGPTMMMKQVATISKRNNWPCQVSMETMMACGIGACLGCTIEGTPTKDTQLPNYLHVCKDGPVFDAEDIKWP